MAVGYWSGPLYAQDVIWSNDGTRGRILYYYTSCPALPFPLPNVFTPRQRSETPIPNRDGPGELTYARRTYYSGHLNEPLPLGQNYCGRPEQFLGLAPFAPGPAPCDQFCAGPDLESLCDDEEAL